MIWSGISEYTHDWIYFGWKVPLRGYLQESESGREGIAADNEP
jgi:hypothetical protein